MIKRLDQIRSLLWPVRRADLHTFIPTFALGFLICFNYYLLRVVKDSVVVTGNASGAAVIPFLKMWGVLPAVIGASFLLSLLFRKLSRPKVYSAVVIGFLLFFGAFAILYPFREALQAHALADYLQSRLPTSFATPIEVFRHWMLSFFYVGCELWKTLVLLVLFWGFVNASSDLGAARRIYGPLTVAGSLAAVLAGRITVFAGKACQTPESMVSWLLGLVVLVGIGCLLLYRVAHKRAPRRRIERIQPRSAMAALRMVLKSRILICISIVIICEYLAFNLVEVLWKQQMFNLFPDTQAYCIYTGRVLVWTGIAGIVGSLFVASNVIRYFGWTTAALLLPAIVLILSVGFYGFTFFASASGAVLLGSIHNVFCRAGRQALADPAKEIAYIPLPDHLQTHGKTFVDGVSPTIGKTSGSLIQQALLIGSPSMLAAAPYSAIIVFGAIAATFAAVFGVGKDYRRSLGRDAREEEALAEAI